MTDTPLVSIVTISFNQAAFLERAILSVLKQDYKNIEYIIVDPGSTDGSREIIEKYRDRIAHILLDPDEGPTDGLNKGFAKAKGEVFAYLNSDDALLPGAITTAVSTFKRYPGTDVVYGDGYIIDENECILRTFYSDWFTPWMYVYAGSVVMQQSTFFKKSAFVDVGGFNVENHIWWDGELMLDFALQGKKMKHFSEKISVFTMHGQSISSNKNTGSEKSQQLDSKRKKWANILYMKVTGKNRGDVPHLAFYAAHILKLIITPNITAKKIFDKYIRKTKCLSILDD